VKDVIGPKGCVSISAAQAKGEAQERRRGFPFQDRGPAPPPRPAHQGPASSLKADEIITTDDEPNHDELCKREQKVLLDAIRKNTDLTDHMNDAVNSLRIVLAADESARTGKTIWEDEDRFRGSAFSVQSLRIVLAADCSTARRSRAGSATPMATWSRTAPWCASRAATS
jgi:hypothetical protein